MSTERQDNHEKEYELALSLMQYHIELLWQEFNSFLLVVTVLLGFLGAALAQTSQLVGRNILIFSGSIFGVIICILWFATYQHNYTYYLLRIKQALRHEPALNINLLTEGGQLSFPLFARLLPPRVSFRLLIILFTIIFITLAGITGPWLSGNYNLP